MYEPEFDHFLQFFYRLNRLPLPKQAAPTELWGGIAMLCFYKQGAPPEPCSMNILCICKQAALLVSGGMVRVCGWVWGFCCFADFVELLSVRFAHVEL